VPRSNLIEDEYQPVEIYKSDDYFGKSQDETVEEPELTS